jgi:hypothetical protein
MELLHSDSSLYVLLAIVGVVAAVIKLFATGGNNRSNDGEAHDNADRIEDQVRRKFLKDHPLL